MSYSSKNIPYDENVRSRTIYYFFFLGHAATICWIFFLKHFYMIIMIILIIIMIHDCHYYYWQDIMQQHILIRITNYQQLKHLEFSWINIITSRAYWIKNPLRRTSENNYNYNFLNFSFSKNLFSFNFKSFFAQKLVIVWSILMWFFK